MFGIYFRGFLRASQPVFRPPSPPAAERGSSAAPRTGSRGAAAMTRLCRGAGAIATLAAARPGRAGPSRDGGTEGGRKEPRGPCPGPAVGHPEAAAAGLSVRDAVPSTRAVGSAAPRAGGFWGAADGHWRGRFSRPRCSWYLLCCWRGVLYWKSSFHLSE